MYITDQIYLHGGGERVLTNKSNYFLENNLAEIFIVTSEQKGNPPCYPINKKVIFKDLAINYDRTKSYFSIANFIKIPSHFFKLKRTIREINPDVVVTLSTQFDFYFLPFIMAKIPKIKEYHSSGHQNALNRQNNTSFLRKLFFKINDYIESKYDTIAVLTKDEEQYYNSHNIVVIPNALTNYPSKTSSLQNKVAISAGRIAPVKQFDKLINAWAYVANVYPDWKLEIYGNGDTNDIEVLQKIINKCNLTNQVQLCGATNELEVAMLNASLYVMSSQTECFPMVLLEAMSCGLPVISFDCPHGPKNIINEAIDGHLVERDNEKKLADAVLSIINNKDNLQKKGKQARENIRRFNQDIIMNQWIVLFNNLTKI